MAPPEDIKHSETVWAARRRAMVDGQIARRDVRDPRILEAMAAVPDKPLTQTERWPDGSVNRKGVCEHKDPL